LEVLLLRKSKSATNVENARKESIGIETKPNSSIYFSVHETPFEQGWMFSGMIPA
jgi:hypothetical protein